MRTYSHNYKEQSQKHRRLSGVDPQIRIPKHHGHNKTTTPTMLLALFFVIMTVCPHLANQFSPVLGMLLNIAALAVLILFGCHNPFMFNQSTLVLGYLLLIGY